MTMAVIVVVVISFLSTLARFFALARFILNETSVGLNSSCRGTFYSSGYISD